MNLYIIGAATTKFGELWETSPRKLAKSAASESLKDGQIEPANIQALFVGNMLSGILGGQEHLGAFFAEELGLPVPAYKIEGACASGGLATHAAIQSILSGQYDTVLVLGVEKMTDHKPEDVAGALMGAGSDDERLAGATFPGLYSLLARAHMEKYGTTEEDMAAVSVKNHFHATLNPNAQFHSQITVANVLKSPLVADPIKLLDCSPISDGAAAIVITNKVKNKRHKSVKILASEVATDAPGLAERSSLVQLSATREAARKAFIKASLEPKNIDIAEVHDCFTIAEILAMEDMAFYKKGEAAAGIARGETTLGKSKHLVVNTSGGLKACGHPVGATGVKQLVEITDQILGRSGKRQVDQAHFGLAHNVGGSGATAVVHILEKV